MTTRILTRLTLSLVLFICSAFASADETPPASSHDSAPEFKKVENAIAHGVKAGIHGVDHGLHAAAGGIETGAKATERGVQHGLKATSHAIDTVAKKVGVATASAATQKP